MEHKVTSCSWSHSLPLGSLGLPELWQCPALSLCTPPSRALSPVLCPSLQDSGSDWCLPPGTPLPVCSPSAQGLCQLDAVCRGIAGSIFLNHSYQPHWCLWFNELWWTELNYTNASLFYHFCGVITIASFCAALNGEQRPESPSETQEMLSRSLSVADSISTKGHSNISSLACSSRALSLLFQEIERLFTSLEIGPAFVTVSVSRMWQIGNTGPVWLPVRRCLPLGSCCHHMRKPVIAHGEALGLTTSSQHWPLDTGRTHLSNESSPQLVTTLPKLLTQRIHEHNKWMF